MTIPDITELALQQMHAAAAPLDQQIAALLSGEQNAQSMNELQRLINKRNTAFQQLQEIHRKQQQALDSFVNNMR